MDNWTISEIKKFASVLVIEKALVKAFPLVGRWLLYKVGKGDIVRIREEPWAGCV
jgi:hypothetical protein